jgi:hypothetical protein
MNRTQYLLCKVAEEASEVAKAALKAQQFGMESMNRDSGMTNERELMFEMCDLIGVLELLNEELSITQDEAFLDHLVDSKKDKTNRYYKICQELGTCS